MNVKRLVQFAIMMSLINVSNLIAGPEKIQKYIMIDQFGYRPGDFKVAVIADPQFGRNSEDSFIPGSVYEVRTWDTDEVVFTDSIDVWNNGAVDFTSGDKGWWFDFTDLTNEGEYYIFDRENNAGSNKFMISDDVYRELLKAAMRVFYYQRLNDPKEIPYAEEPWTDSAAFIGPGQDTEARFVDDKNNPATARDLSGGWMDAGDYNKYVTFADSPVHMLLTAYEQNPKVFTDDYNIPESGNGIPDIIDEIKYEIDWIMKMQDSDGGVLIKMGNIDYNVASPPSSDNRPRYYGPKCSSSAIAAAGMFAHAAIVLSEFPGLEKYCEELKIRAEKAWNWFQNNPHSFNCDSQEIKSGDADKYPHSQKEMEVISAIYLYALTTNEIYNEVVKNNYMITAQFYDTYLSLYFSQHGDALLYYTTIPGADEKAKKEIIEHRMKQGFGLDIFDFKPRADLYMAYIPGALYTWGSNNPRAALGSANYDFIKYNINEDRRENYLRRAHGILHYFHGVNPLGIVYLSNMYKYGAELCTDEIWHDWFSNLSEWDKNPAPGYVPGGPNFYYNGSRIDILTQPVQKCYLNWNNSVPENSWEITEPAIYYQASYVKLLSKFIASD
ncbi:MAG: glycoside hydrolase family 9 protein [Melioribacteraceae bacterium]|nr:glycoside hydrolase family 9 protein [Melioribacteraceae bacterium]